MSLLDEMLREWPEEYEVLISVQDNGRFAAVLCRNSSEQRAGQGASVIEAVTNLEALLDAE